MSKIILYDLPSKGRRACWSLNPWKTRLALNYKNIPYETQWVEYPDIKPTLSPHLPANEPDSSPYTIPAVQYTDGSYSMDSIIIAHRLEKEHPSPSLLLESPLIPKVEVLLTDVRSRLLGHWLARVPTNLLNEPSRDYFFRTREEKYGKPLSQVQKEQGTNEAWEKAIPGIKGLGDLLRETDGPFFMGETVSYADFIIVSFLQFFRVIDEKLLFDHVVEIEPALRKLYDASRQWLERDDH